MDFLWFSGHYLDRWHSGWLKVGRCIGRRCWRWRSDYWSICGRCCLRIAWDGHQFVSSGCCCVVQSGCITCIRNCERKGFLISNYSYQMSTKKIINLTECGRLLIRLASWRSWIVRWRGRSCNATGRWSSSCGRKFGHRWRGRCIGERLNGGGGNRRRLWERIVCQLLYLAGC